MSHGNATVEELYATGRATPDAVRHALEAAERGGDDGGPTTTQEIIDCILDPDCSAVLGNNLEASDTSTATTRSTVSDIDSFSSQFVDDITKQSTQIFFSVPTAEQFLNQFENSFSGFAANAAAAGLSAGDVNQMLDPNSGFMQQSLQEYLGVIAQRAIDGEDPFVLQGQDGEPITIGERAGPTTVTDTERTSETESEQESRQQTSESTAVTTTSGEESGESVQRNRTLDETGRVTETDERTTEVREELDITEELIQRDAIQPIFKFSPTDFFLEKFAQPEGLDPEVVKERFIGALSTEIRTSAPRIRPRGGTPTAVSARRV